MNIENDWSDLEEFKNVGTKSKYVGDKNIPYIRINKNNIFILSSGFLNHAKNQMDGMTHAILNFSKSNNAIVFIFTNNISNKALKISLSTISGKSFFNYHNIYLSNYADKYVAELINIPNIGKSWVIFLKN